MLQLLNFPDNEVAKPPYSYAALICLALATSEKRMTLNQIYNWVRAKFAFYRVGDQSWTVSYFFQFDKDVLSHRVFEKNKLSFTLVPSSSSFFVHANPS